MEEHCIVKSPCDILGACCNVALALIDPVDSYPTSQSPFDSNGHVIAQFLRSL